MARESNLLVLDEPPNDLDIETLDLLQELLSEYDGTVLLVSHDRDFLDRVATSTIALEGDGLAVEYAGGWTDFRAQRGEVGADASIGRKRGKQANKSAAKAPKALKKLSFADQHRLDTLPGEMEKLGVEIAKLTEFMADPNLYTTSPAKFEKASMALSERQVALMEAEEEWLSLEALREEIQG
jgi:ATP-binding cassette subfamily F protein uup